MMILAKIIITKDIQAAFKDVADDIRGLSRNTAYILSPKR